MKIDPEKKYFLVEEVYLNVQNALSYYVTFKNIVGNEQERQHREAWRFLQGFLSHFGMVSKFLFAPGSNRPVSIARSKYLRECLDIPNLNALNNRDARNAIEHLDERIDYWVESDGKGLLESVFQNRAQYDYLDKKNWKIRRVYLVDENIFITEGRDLPKETDLNLIVEPLWALNKKCEEILG